MISLRELAPGLSGDSCHLQDAPAWPRRMRGVCRELVSRLRRRSVGGVGKGRPDGSNLSNASPMRPPNRPDGDGHSCVEPARKLYSGSFVGRLAPFPGVEDPSHSRIARVASGSVRRASRPPAEASSSVQVPLIQFVQSDSALPAVALPPRSLDGGRKIVNCP